VSHIDRYGEKKKKKSEFVLRDNPMMSCAQLASANAMHTQGLGLVVWLVLCSEADSGEVASDHLDEW